MYCLSSMYKWQCTPNSNKCNESLRKWLILNVIHKISLIPDSFSFRFAEKENKQNWRMRKRGKLIFLSKLSSFQFFLFFLFHFFTPSSFNPRLKICEWASSRRSGAMTFVRSNSSSFITCEKRAVNDLQLTNTSWTLWIRITVSTERRIQLWCKVFIISALIGQNPISKSKWWYLIIACKWVPSVEFNFDVHMCWQQVVPYRYIKIKFDVGYFQCYMPLIFLSNGERQPSAEVTFACGSLRLIFASERLRREPQTWKLQFPCSLNTSYNV